MIYEISKDFAFSASHQLTGLREGHQCARIHGHNYVVRVALSGTVLDPNGMLLDYGEFAPFGRWIADNLDHQHLNDVPALQEINPTAENLAEILATTLREQVDTPTGTHLAVSVSETPKTWATVRIGSTP